MIGRAIVERHSSASAWRTRAGAADFTQGAGHAHREWHPAMGRQDGRERWDRGAADFRKSPKAVAAASRMPSGSSSLRRSIKVGTASAAPAPSLPRMNATSRRK